MPIKISNSLVFCILLEFGNISSIIGIFPSLCGAEAQNRKKEDELSIAIADLKRSCACLQVELTKEKDDKLVSL